MMTHYFYRVAYRVGRTSPIHSFINVRSAGHYVTYGDFFDNGGKKDFLEIFWCCGGEGTLHSHGKEIKMSSGDFFCYLPGSTHAIYSDKRGWDYYWLTCDGPDMEAVIRAFGFRQELLHPGPPPENLFNSAIDAIRKIDATGAMEASMAAYGIFTRAVNPLSGDPGEHDFAERFQTLVAENFSDGDFSLQTAADMLGVHRSTLYRIFSAKCGVSPQDYLSRYRMQQAMELLATDMNIKEVAASCGFNAQNYFNRVFRDSFGKTPGEFRRTLAGIGGAVPGMRSRRLTSFLTGKEVRQEKATALLPFDNKRK
ncbi:MAG: AraC family transcriptional regulator [Lentisphaeria bacterium]|nr:AraC family transcriptional regulator [Lentisphaeria bacterium]